MFKERARDRAAIERPATHIDHGLDERVIHWNGALTVARGALRQQSSDRLPNRERDVFNDMMPQVAARMDVQVKPAVLVASAVIM